MTLLPTTAGLPAHYQLTRSQLVFSSVSIAVAFLLLGLVGFRLATLLGLWHWWVPLACVVGMAAADLVSGLIHWSADTWGRDDLPIIGPRLLAPFRIHHVNPDDFLRRRFIDTNGDVAALTVLVLLGLLAVPLDAAWAGPFAVGGFAFCAIGMLTNQIHQWAHMPSPPRLIRALQDGGLLLGRAEHARHHARPYESHYCITTGWCNRPCEAIGLFRRLEAVIERVTGVPPRQDDRRHAERHGVLAPPAEAPRG